MQKIYQHYDACTICNSKKIQHKYTTTDRHYNIKGEYEVWECKNCELHFINPMLTEEYLTSLYPTNYYAYQDVKKKSSIKSWIVKAIGFKIKTKDPSFNRVGKILDVGCGSGWILNEYKQKGWETYGVEVSKDAAELGNKEFNVNIFNGDLHKANFENNYFDFIRSNHSFEHIVNGREVLIEINRILKDDGKLHIGVPNINSFCGKLFKKYWWYLGAPVHTFNYTVKSLTMLLEQTGFNVQKVQYNSDYGGTLGSLQIYLNRKNGKISTQGWVFNNLALKFCFHLFAKFVDLVSVGDVIEITATKNSQKGESK